MAARTCAQLHARPKQASARPNLAVRGSAQTNASPTPPHHPRPTQIRAPPPRPQRPASPLIFPPNRAAILSVN